MAVPGSLRLADVSRASGQTLFLYIVNASIDSQPLAAAARSITDNFIESLPDAAPLLETLVLDGCPHVTAASLASIAKLKKLSAFLRLKPDVQMIAQGPFVQSIHKPDALNLAVHLRHYEIADKLIAAGAPIEPVLIAHSLQTLQWTTSEIDFLTSVWFANAGNRSIWQWRDPQHNTLLHLMAYSACPPETVEKVAPKSLHLLSLIVLVEFPESIAATNAMDLTPQVIAQNTNSVIVSQFVYDGIPSATHLLSAHLQTLLFSFTAFESRKSYLSLLDVVPVELPITSREILEDLGVAPEDGIISLYFAHTLIMFSEPLDLLLKKYPVQIDANAVLVQQGGHETCSLLEFALSRRAPKDVLVLLISKGAKGRLNAFVGWAKSQMKAVRKYMKRGQSATTRNSATSSNVSTSVSSSQAQFEGIAAVFSVLSHEQIDGIVKDFAASSSESRKNDEAALLFLLSNCLEGSPAHLYVQKQNDSDQTVQHDVKEVIEAAPQVSEDLDGVPLQVPVTKAIAQPEDEDIDGVPLASASTVAKQPISHIDDDDIDGVPLSKPTNSS
eukprot:jgi/Hompol1/5730/HPOL_004675-RA